MTLLIMSNSVLSQSIDDIKGDMHLNEVKLLMAPEIVGWSKRQQSVWELYREETIRLVGGSLKIQFLNLPTTGMPLSPGLLFIPVSVIAQQMYV